MSTTTMLNLPLTILILVLVPTTVVRAHQESGEWGCEPDPEARVSAQFRPGIVSIDGHADDWKDVDGFEFPLYPAIDPDADHQYTGGKMTVKALHDGKDMHFMLQVDGNYVYSKGDDKKCASVALMFQVGDSATYHDMGGCKESKVTCTSKSCRGFEVDIMHFSVGTAVPGRLYGGNPVDNRDGNGNDRFGHLVDMYAWNPHCRNLDGISPSGNNTSAQNDWKGAWWHDSFITHSGFIEEDSPYSSSGQKGTYYFEFSRPLRTMDRLQQDVQFSIGQTSKFSVAFWYPVNGKAWTGIEHYTVSCDWVPLDISSGNFRISGSASGSSSDGASAFALLLSVFALCVSIFIGYKITRSKSTSFTPISNL